MIFKNTRNRKHTCSLRKRTKANVESNEYAGSKWSETICYDFF